MSCTDPRTYVLLVILSTNITLAIATTDKICTSQSYPHPYGLCGSELSNIMQLICGERGFNARLVKRGHEMKGMYLYK